MIHRDILRLKRIHQIGIQFFCNVIVGIDAERDFVLQPAIAHVTKRVVLCAVHSTILAQFAIVKTLSAQVIGIADETDLRSEEHTSELQSLMRISYAVFCLKKKKTT